MKFVVSSLYVIITCIFFIAAGVALDSSEESDEEFILDPSSPSEPEILPSVGNITSYFLGFSRPFRTTTIIPGTDCECVSYYLCKNNTINTNGEGLVDTRKRRSASRCPEYFVCCPLPRNVAVNNTAIPPLVNKTVTTKPRVSSYCGKRNADGVGFRMFGNDETEFGRNATGVGFRMLNETHHETEFGEFPWMAAVWMADKHQPKSHLTVKCVGSLIHPKVVITAGHCVSDKARQRHLRVRLGEWDLQSTAEIIKHQDRVVEKVVIYNKKYCPRGLKNDIALLFLQDPVEIKDNVDTICLPDSDVNFDNDRCIVAGWGALSGVNYHEVRYLKQVELSMVPQNACSKSLRKTSRRRKKFGLQKSFICADGAGKEHINICKEDSGAPLFCPIPGQLSRYQQVGIVSKGIGCRNIGVPAMFTNVPLFRKWIDQQMKLHSLEQNTYNI